MANNTFKTNRKEVFADLRDAKGFLSKSKIGDALRYLGYNPLNKEVSKTHFINKCQNYEIFL